MGRGLRECKEAAPEAFLKSGMTRLVGSSADTVFYATVGRHVLSHSHWAFSFS